MIADDLYPILLRKSTQVYFKLSLNFNGGDTRPTTEICLRNWLLENVVKWKPYN